MSFFIDEELFIKKLFFTIFLGFTIYLILIFLNNINIKQIEGQRLIRDFWIDRNLSVTLVGLLCSIVIGYFFYSIFCKGKILLKIFSCFSLIIAFLNS